MSALSELVFWRDDSAQAGGCHCHELCHAFGGKRRARSHRQLGKQRAPGLQPTPVRLGDGVVRAGADETATIAEVQAGGPVRYADECRDSLWITSLHQESEERRISEPTTELIRRQAQDLLSKSFVRLRGRRGLRASLAAEESHSLVARG